MSSNISQTDYQVKEKPIIPTYIQNKIFQQTGGQSVTIGTSATESIFELPPKCLNINRSSISFEATMPMVNGAYPFLYTDVIAPIRQIQLYTRGGTYLINTDNQDKHSSVALKVKQTKDNASIVDTAITVGTSLTVETFGSVCGTATNYNYGSVDKNQNPFEPQYLRKGVVMDNTSAGNITTTTSKLSINIPLSLFKDTIAELDKDFFFNDILMLKITWNAYPSWGFTATTNSTTMVALASNITINKLSLYLALETNPYICAGLINRVTTGGMTTNIPFTYMSKKVFNGETNQNVSVRINNKHGKYLKHIYHIIYNATENAPATRYSHTNVDKANITSYFTTVDNDRRQQFDVNVALNEDWLIIKDYVKNTLIDRVDTYRYNWFVLDKFDDSDCNDNDCIDSGFPLTGEHTWDFVGTTAAAAFNHYTFFVVSRQLFIGPNGIALI
jgi:hypothetical protein